jgi:predicted MPP superfamily phosphohydrolase
MLPSVTGSLGLAATGALAYAAWIEPYAIQTVPMEIYLPRLPEAFDGYTILQISDLHMRQMGRREKALRRILSGMRKPDLVVYTGDLVYTPKGIEPFIKLASAIAGRDGSFAIFGNSEHKNGVRPQVFAERLENAAITPLLNRHVKIARGDANFYLLGVDDPVSHHDDLEAAFDGIPTDAFQLLLMHTPDSVGLACARGVDLVLSGHTHGGQIKAPILGALYTHSYLGRAMAHGLYEGKSLKKIIGFRPGRTQLYVTRGIGVSGMSLRFLCRPELTILTLRTGAAGPRTNRRR